MYIGIPHDLLVVWAGLMRTWLGSILRICTRGEPTEKNPVLMLIDEAGHLGHMRALQDGITLMRGMGIRIWLFFQNLGQLHECYGQHAPIIMGNMDTCQYFGLNDFETAELVSKRIGEQTILVGTDNGGGSESWPVGVSGREPQPGNRSSNWGWSQSPTGRAVLQPSEILVLPEHVCLIFHRNLPCIPATLVKYFEAKEFKNGGIGVQRGVGLGAMLASAAVLMASFMLAAGITGEPLPELPRLAGLPMAHKGQSGMAGGYPPPYGTSSQDDINFFLPPTPQPVRGRSYGQKPAYRPKPWQLSPAEDRFNFWDPSSWGY